MRRFGRLCPFVVQWRGSAIGEKENFIDNPHETIICAQVEMGSFFNAAEPLSKITGAKFFSLLVYFSALQDLVSLLLVLRDGKIDFVVSESWAVDVLHHVDGLDLQGSRGPVRPVARVRVLCRVGVCGL